MYWIIFLISFGRTINCRFMNINCFSINIFPRQMGRYFNIWAFPSPNITSVLLLLFFLIYFFSRFENFSFTSNLSINIFLLPKICHVVSFFSFFLFCRFWTEILKNWKLLPLIKHNISNNNSTRPLIELSWKQYLLCHEFDIF